MRCSGCPAALRLKQQNMRASLRFFGAASASPGRVVAAASPAGPVPNPAIMLVQLWTVAVPRCAASDRDCHQWSVMPQFKSVDSESD